MSRPKLRITTLCSGLIAEQRLRQRAARACPATPDLSDLGTLLTLSECLHGVGQQPSAAQLYATFAVFYRPNQLPGAAAVLILGFGWVKGWSGRVLGGCCGREVSPLRHRGWEVRFCGGGSALPRRRSLIHRLHGGSRHPDRLLAPLLRGAA